jgi:hypothetical protein
MRNLSCIFQQYICVWLQTHHPCEYTYYWKQNNKKLIQDYIPHWYTTGCDLRIVSGLQATLVWVTTWDRVKLRLISQVFSKFHETTQVTKWQFGNLETLKTQVEQILDFSRTHCNYLFVIVPSIKKKPSIISQKE